jgi:hypothetical protein
MLDVLHWSFFAKLSLDHLGLTRVCNSLGFVSSGPQMIVVRS